MDTVKIEQHEHNKAAYLSAARLLKETGKVAVVHPTGTGKSFIGFQLCADHLAEIICWVSPSEKTQVEKLEIFSRKGGAICKNRR